MTFRDEAKIGDRMNVMWRNTKLDVFSGTVVEIARAEVGQAYIVVPDGKKLEVDGAVHVSEFSAVLAVWRTEVWLTLPLPFSREEIALKCQRMDANEIKRRLKKVPLLAPVLPARMLDINEVERRFRAGEVADYERAKLNVEKCLVMRERVRELMTPDAFAAVLKHNSEGFISSTDPLRRIDVWASLLTEMYEGAA